MGFDLDPFDDIFPEGASKNVAARAGGKFQPKAKLRPKKQPSASASVLSEPSVRTVDIVENELSETLSTGKPSGIKEDVLSGVHFSDDDRSSELMNASSEHVVPRENMAPISGLHSDIVMPESSGDWHSCFGKSAGENADIFLGLESLDDFLSQPTSVPVNTASGSLREADTSAQLVNKFSATCPVNTDAESSLPPSEAPNVHVLGAKNSEKGFGIPVVSPVGNSAQFQEAEAFPCLEALDIMSELTATSGGRSGKLQPKPKLLIHTEKSVASIHNPDAVESVSRPLDTHLVHSEAEYIDEVSIHGLPPDDVLDFSSMGFSDSIPTETTSELLVNEEPTNLLGTPHSDVAIPKEHPEAVPEMLGKVASQRENSGKRRTPMVSDSSLRFQEASTYGQEDGTRRSLRQRQRKQVNAFELVDEFEDEARDDEEFQAEHPSGSVSNVDGNNDEEYQVENESQNRRVQRKSKKPVAEKEKPVRKRKKASDASDQSTKAPPKKFSHSTRRKRRCVDKVLLETPEDEIDLQKLTIRDLILLAEYKERVSKKEATSETPLMNQSAGNSSAQYGEYETFVSEEGRNQNDDQGNPSVQESSAYVNYQTYMDRTPTVRWSKQDTELFYEAVRQFGTDLSMIQQLFPGRTRTQVKLKYKKEERQHPLRLRDALINRAKDHSHFEQVIERLKQLAAQEAQEKQNSIRDDSIGLTGEEEMEGVTSETNEEVAISEQFEEEVKYMEPDVSEIQSPMKSEDSEDDLYRWSQYKSEL